jgi:hypothetical protein
MDHSEITNQKLLDASNLAIARLSRFASVAESMIYQAFVVKEDHFCGIRFRAGAFRAEWLFDQTWIEIKRGDHVIEQMTFGDEAAPSRRAA